MGKASSSKKVARAARAGGTRSRGQRRNIGFPLVCGMVVVLGVALVFFARDQREASADPKTTDHWHAAYGVNICGDVQNPIVSQNDPLGIHTHGDGIIHIHPFLNSSSGTNARLGVFLDTVGAKVTDKAIEMPDGTKVEEGKDDCDGEAAIVQVARWRNAADATAGEKPDEIITDDFDRIRFRSDREAFTIAFLPEGDEILAPSTIPTLDNLSDVIEAPGSTTTTDSTTSTSTSSSGSTDTTAAVSTDSTTPDTSTTTSAP